MTRFGLPVRLRAAGGTAHTRSMLIFNRRLNAGEKLFGNPQTFRVLPVSGQVVLVVEWIGTDGVHRTTTLAGPGAAARTV